MSICCGCVIPVDPRRRLIPLTRRFHDPVDGLTEYYESIDAFLANGRASANNDVRAFLENVKLRSGAKIDTLIMRQHPAGANCIRSDVVTSLAEGSCN
jgi:hypothetical protein